MHGHSRREAVNTVRPILARQDALVYAVVLIPPSIASS